MKAEKRILIESMPGLYAVGTATLGGEPFYIAASELRGGSAAVISCGSGDVSEITGGQGGVMGIMGSVNENCLLSIEEFYQGFDAPHSKIVEIQLEKKDGKWQTASRRQLAEVPYLHRLGVLEEPDGCFLACGKLCVKKDYTDDWSSGGTLEMLSFDGNEVTARETIHEGLFKHHAMLIEKDSAGDILYFGGTEGLFSAVRENGSWKVSRLLDVPTSEIVYTDLDGDGKREIAIVEEFHGDRLAVFKDRGSGYERAMEFPMVLGHALWGGRIAGRTALVSGSRDGVGDLTVREFRTDEGGSLVLESEFAVDKGIGPSQIAVRDLGDHAEILTACYLLGRLAIYTLS